MRRRGVLSLPVVVAAGAVGCSRSGGSGPAVSGSGEASGSGTVDAGGGGSASASASASGAGPGAVVMDGSLGDGRPCRVEVGPAVRSGDYTVVRLLFTTDEEDGYAVHLSGDHSLKDVCLLSLEQGVVWPERDTSWVLAGPSVSKDEPEEFFAVFDAVDEPVSSVEVLVPCFGVAVGVGVVDESESAFPVAQAIAQAELDRGGTGPVPITWFSGAADGSYEVDRDESSVTVSLASDVTFAFGSADLTDQADAVLQAAVDQLALYPSAGAVSIVGHTDDVSSEEFNMELSQRRAQAVSDRLGQLTDLSAWQVTVEGRGETQPRAEGTSEEARAANRRVEVVATPVDPSEAGSGAASGQVSGQMPPATGAQGPGPDGVDVEFKDIGTVRMSIDQVRRVGSFLIGTVLATASSGQGSLGLSLNLPKPFDRRWAGRGGADYGGSDGLTLLAGSMRFLAGD